MVDGLATDQTTINQQLNGDLNATARLLNGTLKTIGDLSNNIAQLAQIDQTRFKQLVSRLSVLIGGLCEQVQQFLSTIVIPDRQLITTQLYAMQQSLVDLHGTLQRFVLNEDGPHRMNLQLQRVLTFYDSTPDVFGRMLKPFLEDRGTPPGGINNIPELIASQAMADQILRYISVVNGVKRGYTTHITYRCSSAFLVRVGAIY